MHRSFLTAILLASLVLAASLSLAAMLLAFGKTLSGDPASYVNIAQNVLSGDGFVRDHGPLPEGLRAYYPPAYPVLLAVFGALLPLDPPTFLFINLLVTVTTTAAIIWLADALRYPPSVGVIAASFFLLWPTNVLMAPVAHKEGLSTLLALLAVGFLIKRRALAFGTVSGLLALTQPALVTFPALAAIALYWRGGWLRFVSIGAAAFALVMLPWWVRNYLLLGQFVPLTTASGMNFWVGTMGDGVGYSHEVQKFAHLPEIERTPAAFRDAFAYIAADPLDYIRHTLGKAGAMLQGDLWGTKPLYWMQPLRPGSFFLREVPYYASITLFALAAVGAVVSKCRALKLILAASLIQLFVVQIWFQFPERHRYFMVPFLMLLAVGGAWRIASHFHERKLDRRQGKGAA